MANHSSAKKAIRQIERRTELNKSRVSRVRTFIKKVESFIAEGKKTEATTALRQAESEMMRSAAKGVFHKNTASRKISRLSQRLKGIA